MIANEKKNFVQKTNSKWPIVSVLEKILALQGPVQKELTNLIVGASQIINGDYRPESFNHSPMLDLMARRSPNPTYKFHSLIVNSSDLNNLRDALYDSLQWDSCSTLLSERFTKLNKHSDYSFQDFVQENLQRPKILLHAMQFYVDELGSWGDASRISNWYLLLLNNHKIENADDNSKLLMSIGSLISSDYDHRYASIFKLAIESTSDPILSSEACLRYFFANYNTMGLKAHKINRQLDDKLKTLLAETKSSEDYIVIFSISKIIDLVSLAISRQQEKFNEIAISLYDFLKNGNSSTNNLSDRSYGYLQFIVYALSHYIVKLEQWHLGFIIIDMRKIYFDNNEKIISEIDLNLAMCKYHLREYESAIEFAKSASAVSLDLGDTVNYAQLLKLLAVIYDDIGEQERSIEYLAIIDGLIF